MKGFELFAVATVAEIFVTAWLFTLGFDGPGDAAAIRLSAIVAVAVQLVGFALLKLLGGKSLLAGRGAGAVVRILTLPVYALVAAKVLELPPTAALLSLVTFFFLTTLIEPLFLKV